MERVKFSRTPHLPWSPGFSGDDVRLVDLGPFPRMKEIVVTEKLDGENTTFYSDGYMHARSPDAKSHPSRDWVKKYMSSRVSDIPEGWRVCGENVYGIHSIEYTKLPTFFFVFSIITENGLVLSWEDTEEFAELLDLTLVPVLYKGPWDEKVLRSLPPATSRYGPAIEGYVVRNSAAFFEDEYGKNVCKYVRKGHVQTDEHWTKNWRPASLES